MKEIRNFKIDAPENEQNHILTGMAIVFNQKAHIVDKNGSYYEVIRSGALDEADLSDCHLFYNHDLSTVPLARTPKTMTLTKSPAGLKVTAQLPKTAEADSVYTAVKRGDLSGMSFAFTVPKGGDTYDSKTNTRTINKINKVYELSVVPFPAYPQTSVEARGRIEQEKLKQQALISLNQILYKGE